ncbi:MAG: hypothetical protein V4739_04730 [Pseudomonadota bacterium]
MKQTGLTKGRVSQLLDDSQPFGEVAARRICEALGIELDYFDRDDETLLRNIDSGLTDVQNGPLIVADQGDRAVRSQQQILWDIWTKLREEDRGAWLATARSIITAREASDLDESIAALSTKAPAAKKA